MATSQRKIIAGIFPAEVFDRRKICLMQLGQKVLLKGQRSTSPTSYMEAVNWEEIFERVFSNSSIYVDKFFVLCGFNLCDYSIYIEFLLNQL